ncbi:MAG: DNA polymerase I [Bacteroidales bacterium]|jgi:DNA polymerase-1|nr:DNA polymerase I [Bacteroidales bacterium]
MSKKLFLLDAMALIFRAYYAMSKSHRYTSKGVNTSAILGFTNTLYDVIKSEKPTHIAVSFDTGAPTIRHADFDQYKAHREETPEDIVNSVPYIKKMVEAFNIPILEMDGYEADDVIGTTAKLAEINGFEVYMMTSDKDYGQLVSEHIRIYKPGKFGQPAEVIGVQGVCEKYGIENPEQLIDILGLWGDASDNIPGVPNIGQVKATKLIAQFGSIENIYKHIDQVGHDKMRNDLITYKDQAMMSKMLATIILDVPITPDFDKMAYKGPNPQKLKEVFDELEFKALTQRIFKDLKLKDETIPAQPDLFSSLEDVEMEMPEKETLFRCFKDQPHHFVEITKKEEVENLLNQNKTLYFDWIYDGKIDGFALAGSDENIYYYLYENKGKQDDCFLDTVFSTDKQIVTFHCKQSWKIFKELQKEHPINFFDLEIAHYLIQPENSHSLERMSERYLSYSLFDAQSKVKHFKPFEAICEKIEVYKQLFPVFKEELEKDNLTPLFREIEMPLSQVLAEMEYNGIKVDCDVLGQNSAQLNTDVENLEKQIFEYAGITFNLASPKQLGEILFEKMRVIDNAKLTKTKQYQTGEEVLAKLVNKHPIVPLILEWRSLSKLKTTYIDALPQLIDPTDERIHTTFNQTVTSTGRLSSTNPNLQNIPIRTERGRDIRRAFVAGDNDSVLISADYSQIELRIVADVCGDERMINMFKDGEDIHAGMAAEIYGISIQEVTAQMRRNAKTVNFGILYGMSAFGLAERLQIPQSEARDLIERYFLNFPKINHYLENTIEFAKENGYVETLLGRRRYIRDIQSGNGILRKAAERNAINAPIQGTAADLIKIAMVEIFNALQAEGYKTKMVLQVHDELLFDAPSNEAARIMPLIEHKMTNAMSFKVPLAVEINKGKSWYDAH